MKRSAKAGANKQAWITSRDIAILAAFLGFVVFAMPALVDLAGVLELVIKDPSSVQVLSSLTVAVFVLFAALGVVAAWQSKPVLAWVVAAAFLLLWLQDLRDFVLLHFVILASGPFLFILSAVLTTAVRKRKHVEEGRPD